MLIRIYQNRGRKKIKQGSRDLEVIKEYLDVPWCDSQRPCGPGLMKDSKPNISFVQIQSWILCWYDSMSMTCIHPFLGMLLPQNREYKTTSQPWFEQRKKKKESQTQCLNVLKKKVVTPVCLVQVKMQTRGEIPAGNGSMNHFQTIAESLFAFCHPKLVAKTRRQPVCPRRKSFPPHRAASVSLNLLDFHVIVFPRYCPTNILQS